MARTPDFDAWLIAWPSGGKVDLHDHGHSTGAVSVISGALVEAVPWRDDSGRLSLVRHELQAGATLGFGAGHVHDVTNESEQQALSLHVYSPALTSMTFYEVAGDQLVVREVAWTDDGSGEFEEALEDRTLQTTQRGGLAAASR
jgi:predicted metal-dependent enzyme (double-stranded beta helix superfamily)